MRTVSEGWLVTSAKPKWRRARPTTVASSSTQSTDRPRQLCR